MDFGKLYNVDRVRFELPPDSMRNVRVLPGASRPLKAYLGAPVWSVKEWVGSIYPKKTPAREFLKHYSRRFNTIELNSTFYHIPDPKLVAQWKAMVSAEFRFAPKVVQTVSHQNDLVAAKAILRTFCATMSELGENLGPSFLQLPPSFGPRDRTSLEKLLEAVPAGYRLSVEFRHPDWFTDRELPEGLLSFLSERGLGTVITDTAGRRDVVHSSLTTRTAMVRFLGNRLHPSDFVRLDDWTDRIASWARAGLEEIYFFLHQPDNVNVPELEEYLAAKLRRHKIEIPAAAPLPEAPGQLSLL